MAWALLSIMEQPRFHTEEPAQRVRMALSPPEKRQPGSIKLNQNDIILVLMGAKVLAFIIFLADY